MRRRARRRAVRRSGRAIPSRRQCGTMQAHFRLLEVDPGFRARQAALEHATVARMARAVVPWKVVTIPTVVHVVHNSPAENISDAQVKSQISVLNRDFRKLNPDRSRVPAVWAGLVADASRLVTGFLLQDGQDDARDSRHVCAVDGHRRPAYPWACPTPRGDGAVLPDREGRGRSR